MEEGEDERRSTEREGEPAQLTVSAGLPQLDRHAGAIR
jgi:hypothetical protein